MPVKFSKPPVIRRPLKLALLGKSDSGKTYTALTFARELGGQWAFIDTDCKRVEDYAKTLKLNDWCSRTHFSLADKLKPAKYIEAIDAAEEGDFAGLIIDTASPFWLGILDIHASRSEELASKGHGKAPEAYTIQAWAGPKGGNRPFYEVMGRIAESPLHVICTFRLKMEFDSSQGYLKPTGDWAPVFRKGDHMYEFTLVGWLERNKKGNVRTLIFEKTGSCHELEGESFENPGKEVLSIIRKWRGL